MTELLTDNLELNITKIGRRLPVEASFDVIGRRIKVGGRGGYLVFVDGFAKDEIMYRVISCLQTMSGMPPGIPVSIPAFIRDKIAYLEAEPFTELAAMEQAVLSGGVALIVDGESEGVLIDCREYPARSPQEPEAEKVTRGAKDGFVETIVFNTALIRRRVRDNRLTFEMKTVGSSSRTDVCLGYVDGLADSSLIDELRQKIDSVDVDALVMAEKSLEELLIKKRWYNPLPQVKYTERPDIAASYLLEGHAVILVDTSPAVMIAPATLFYFTQYAEDYYENTLVGTYNRWMRFGAVFVSLMLIPVWLLLAENKESLPAFLQFIGVKEGGAALPLLLQFLALEAGFDFLKASALHTPSYLGGAFGIIGGLLLGEFAVKVGFFVPETIFYMALSAMASYCIPSVEFASAIRIFRLVLLITTGLFGIYGFCAGLVLIFFITLTTNTVYSRRKYLWPLWPLNMPALLRVVLRRPVQSKGK